MGEGSFKVIYLDHGATTPIKKEVLEEMLPYLTEQYGNPSSLYSFARKSKRAVEKARSQVADAINAKKSEFTLLVVEQKVIIGQLSAAYYYKNKETYNTSSIEHHSVLNTCKALEKEGFEITYLPVDEYGKISIEELKKAIRKTILISLMTANNEIGTIEPIAEIGK